MLHILDQIYIVQINVYLHIPGSSRLIKTTSNFLASSGCGTRFTWNEIGIFGVTFHN